MITHYFCKIVAILALMALFSCFGSAGTNLDSRDEDLYSRIGYKPGNTPLDQEVANFNGTIQRRGVKIVPDYYYRGPDQKLAPRSAGRAPTNRMVSVKYKPSSRYYNNPYSFKPPANFPYFDSDQYYVPPQGIRNRGSGFDEDPSSRRSSDQGQNVNHKLY